MMNLRSTSAALLCALALPSAASAQGFSYPDFSSTSGLALNGAALSVNSVMRVTEAIISQKGSVWYDQAVPVINGFDTQFEFQYTQPSAGGGDGMAFLIQNDADGTAALTQHASALGYGAFANDPPGTAMQNCIAIELDSYNNGSPWFDLDANHISVHTGGTSDNSQAEDFSIGRVSPATNMSDGLVHTLRIRYTPGTLDIFLDDLVNPVLTVPYDFTTGGTYLSGGPVGGLNLINGDSAIVGFTASNGGAWENHDVVSWDWSYGTLGQSYCGPAVPNSTGSPGVITAAGSSLAADNDVTLTASGLPLNQFGYFLNSQTQGNVFPVPNSQGVLCLGGAIGRYNAPGSIFNTGNTGAGSLVLDLTSTPTPSGSVSVQAGETWNFTTWYRDNNPGSTSNFTDGVTISFQ